MKEELITGILQDMIGKIDAEQIRELKVVLYMQLHNLWFTADKLLFSLEKLPIKQTERSYFI